MQSMSAPTIAALKLLSPLPVVYRFNPMESRRGREESGPGTLRKPTFPIICLVPNLRLRSCQAHRVTLIMHPAHHRRGMLGIS